MATKELSNIRIKNKYDDISNYQETNIVLMQGEIAFVKDDQDFALYVGDGETPFNDLIPLYSTKYVVGIDKLDLTTVKLQPNAWVDNEQVVNVPGVKVEEDTQLIIPTYSQASKLACMSAGLDYYVKADGQLVFTVNEVPTEILTVFIGIFGAQKPGDSEKPVIRVDIDDILSNESENPVMNKVITTKIDSIEASIRSITGTESGGESSTSLSSISTKLDNATNYTVENKIKIGTYNGANNYRQMLSYAVSVSYDTLEADSDIGIMTISGHTLTFNDLSNVYWSGKAESGEFYGNFPCRVTVDGKIQMINVPVGNEAYTLSGYIVIEGTDFTLT